LKPGHSVEVEGFIPLDCKEFVINLGTYEKNLALHFNPRFDSYEDKKVILLNSMKDDVWGQDLRETFFPFQEGSDTMPLEVLNIRLRRVVPLVKMAAGGSARCLAV
ncbi:unnamed protein product, partial [Staurois parvus]